MFLARFSRAGLSSRAFLNRLRACLITRKKQTSAGVADAHAANRKCRVELATAFRALDKFGMSEGVCTHLSMMAPAANGDGRVMLMIPHGLHWSRATPSSLIAVNEVCEVVEGRGLTQVEACVIHKGIHDARPDADCVFHLHPPYSTAMAMLEENAFKMYHQTHCRFYNEFAYDTDFEGAAKCYDEGERLASILGDGSVLFMKNHGVLVAAANAALAFDHAYYLERACMHQMLAMATNKKLQELPDDVSKLTYEQTKKGLQHYADLHFSGVFELLINEDPTFIEK